MTQPHVSSARDTNLSFSFPHRGRLEYITVVTLLLHYLPPESQLPQHKVTISSETPGLKMVTLLCSQGAVPKKCCYTQDLPSGEGKRDLRVVSSVTETSSPLTHLLALSIVTQQE